VALAVAGLSEGRVIVIVPRVLQFIYRTNTGAAWSMFSDRTGLLTIFATIVAIGLTIWSLRLRSARACPAPAALADPRRRRREPDRPVPVGLRHRFY
jgi:lipoprotein signal peptidase